MVAGNGQPTALDEAVPAPAHSATLPLGHFATSPSAPLPPLPPLPPADHPILEAYIRHDADLHKIAEATGKSIHEVLQALSTAPLRDYIAQATALADEADRRLAAATLRDTIRTSDSPVEKRRAASALGRIVHLTRAAAAADRRTAASERAALHRTLRSLNHRGPASTQHPARSTQHDPADPGLRTQDSGPRTQDPTPPDHSTTPPPPPLQDHALRTPGEAVAAFLINLRAGDTADLWKVLDRTDTNTSMFVRMDELNHRRFRQELADALPILERGDWRTAPPRVDGDAGTIRVIFTHDAGDQFACTFRVVKAQLHYSPFCWFVDGISRDDSG